MVFLYKFAVFCFEGFEREEEEEIALMEEKEAKTLQNRLAAELDDVDLTLGLITKVWQFNLNNS